MNHFGLRLGDLPISGYRIEPEPGAYVLQLRERIDGWGNAPDRTPRYPSASGDGSTAGMRQLGGRALMLPLTIKSHSQFGPGSVDEAVRTIQRMHRTTLYASEAGLYREVDVTVGVPRITDESTTFSVMTLPLTADDPLRHRSGHVDLPAGTTLLPNGGDMQAWPIIEASGVVTFTVTHPGGTLNATMPSGPHEIHTRTGRMYNRSTGVQVHGQMSGPMPYVLPGGSQWDVGGIVTGLIRVRRWEAWS